MSAVEEIIIKGEQSISGFPMRADELTAVIQSNFTATTLEEVHQAFAKMPTPSGEKGGVNTEVTKLYKLVREQAAVAVEEYRNAEMWLAVKAPSVSDGNNFGVGVHYCQTMRLCACALNESVPLRRGRCAKLRAERAECDATKGSGYGRGAQHVPLAARCVMRFVDEVCPSDGNWKRASAFTPPLTSTCSDNGGRARH